MRSPLDDDGAAALKRGVLVHRLLQLLPEVAPAERPSATEAFLARPGHALTPQQQKAIAQQVLAVLDDTRFAPLFGAGSLAEVPIAAVLGRTVIAGQVDRLLVRDDAVVVVDYKSGRPPPTSGAAAPVPYLRQMAAYRAALRAVFPERRVTCGLLFTDGPNLLWLNNKTLDAHAP